MVSMKKALAIAGAAAMLMSFAACGSSSSSEGDGKGEISFQTWNLKNDKYTPYFTDLIAAYEKSHPGTTIKWVDQPSDNYEQKLSADAAAGSLPDIIDAGPSLMYGLAKAGALMNITKEDPKAADLYYQGAWNAVTFKGNGVEEGSYGYPWYVNDGPMYYNTEVMSKCGLDPSRLPITWDDYFSQAETMVKSGCGASMSTMMGGAVDDYAAAGVKIMNSDHTKYTFNTAKAVAHLQRFIDLYKAGGIPQEALSAQWSQQGEFFQKGSIIAMGGSAYSAADFKQNSPDLYEHLAVGPKITDEGKSDTVSYEMLAVNAQTKNKALALDFVKYVTNAKNQLKFAKESNTFPSSKGGLEDPYYTKLDTSTVQGQALAVTLKAVKTGYSSRPAEFTDANGSLYLQQQAALALQGKQSAKEALDKAVQFADQKLKQ
ncbi:ABC transporter substrate-binding protein [Bifidobacterium sp.]|jgi:multiple sugar transport system substrate-binding protein|uniref:ABC transporter substrate-binding protein n=1 Tax=Bifidobacterium sp. TaxID=41200 RepID=UPI0025C54EF0|nr:extracellular solute-binding protein [Bifidobacterium sp.]MCH4208781.1 extracellular solute-binding protein [Bifidobacterium sp.]MCI1224041.1 extracellular solute-binding protein [Bifidobacterium sp.]